MEVIGSHQEPSRATRIGSRCGWLIVQRWRGDHNSLKRQILDNKRNPTVMKRVERWRIVWNVSQSPAEIVEINNSTQQSFCKFDERTFDGFLSTGI